MGCSRTAERSPEKRPAVKWKTAARHWVSGGVRNGGEGGEEGKRDVPDFAWALGASAIVTRDIRTLCCD